MRSIGTEKQQGIGTERQKLSKYYLYNRVRFDDKINKIIAIKMHEHVTQQQTFFNSGLSAAIPLFKSSKSASLKGLSGEI
jgi:hypothetical protein